jgi:hypothetical protein
MRRILLALVLALAAAPLAAYTIYLKDGGTLLAREKYKVQGNLAIVTLPSGAQTQLPLAQIDVARTQAGNASDFGSATILTGAAPTPTPPPTQPKQASLAEIAAARRLQSNRTPPPATRATPPPSTPASRAAAANDTNTTPAGSVDFLRIPRSPMLNLSLTNTVSELMGSHGVSRAGIYQGSQPRRLLIEVSANSEGGVFQAIGAAAQALLELQVKQPGTVDAFELFLVTDKRQRGGQFLITPERAQELVGKRLDLTAFYLKYVEF